MITENGWPSTGRDNLDVSPFPGTDVKVPLQRGSASMILKAFAADYNILVEPLRQHDCGGWTPTNDVPTSNHLGGTAMDLNWQLHPFHAKDTFTPEQMGTLREILAYYEGMIYWGGDWTTPIDEMHWQMGYNTYNTGKPEEFISRKISDDGFSKFLQDKQLRPMLRAVVPGSNGTTWADVSQYQLHAVNELYPHRVLSFRTNTGSQEDTLGVENARAAKQLLEQGKLDIVIPYYFFRPGQANCDLHREVLERAAFWNHSRTVTMVDVEGDKGSVTGDNSWEINDEINRLRGWYQNYGRVIGYYNSNADPGLWTYRNGVPLVIPQYGRDRGDLSSVKDKKVLAEAFAHQYTSTAKDVQPWGGINVDLNWAPYNIDELLALFGMSEQEASSDMSDLVSSLSRYRDDDEKRWTIEDLIRFIDARTHEFEVESLALLGSQSHIDLVKSKSKDDPIAQLILKRVKK
jgi:hypothetical protein